MTTTDWSAWSRSHRSAYLRSEPVADDPVLEGSGPAECSSCTALSVVPAFIWDTNRYYRALGVPTDASRRDLMRAYQARQGQRSARLTYVFHQLLDPEIRRAYDRTPLGDLFVDKYVDEMIRKIANDRMSREMADAARRRVLVDDALEQMLKAHIYADMGLEDQSETESDTPVETVDPDLLVAEDGHRPATFEYSFYRWRTRIRDGALSRRWMAQWQTYLVRAFSREGVDIRFAVGLHGEPHNWIQAVVGYRTVFFLNIATEPTEELAHGVAVRVRLDREREQQRITLASTTPTRETR